MKTPIPPLHSITIDRRDGGFANDVYFTFAETKDSEIVWASAFRSRIQLKGSAISFAENLKNVAAANDSNQAVAEKIRTFVRDACVDQPLSDRLRKMSDQIEAGQGPMTRRGDELFMDGSET